MSSKNKQKKKDNIFSLKYFVYDFIRFTGALPMALWLRPKVYYAGDKKEIKKIKSMLIMSNHTGMMDGVIIHFAFIYRRLWMLALDSMFKKKFSRWFFTNLNCIEINRENMSTTSYNNMVKYLKKDKAVCIFPEGQIEVEENQLQQFKQGLTFISILNKTPIVPVYIVRRKSFWHRERIIVGNPINLAEHCSAIPTLPEIESANKILFEKEEELKLFYENNIRRKK